MATSTLLGSAANFIYGNGKWWGAHIQPFACLKLTLKGTGLHQHHLVPRSLMEHGPARMRRFVDYIPSVTLAPHEHLASVHGALNAHLAAKGFWQVQLTEPRLVQAIRSVAEFYKKHGLSHFAEAVEE